MIIKTEDYCVECVEENKATLSGVMRLPNPTSYDKPFDPIKKSIESGCEKYTIDMRELTFLNSSGITALARLVITARQKDVEIAIVAKENIPWQKKSIQSLQNLWKKFSVEFK